ncbi:MAG: Coenzyme F420 hydrogenase/dehydrogenase, beta subunit C-terminal domain, partial [Candidatus Freyarchaeota archaeon]
GVKPDEVAELDYRGLGWPGSMLIRLKKGLSLRVPYVGGWKAYWPLFSSFFFTPWRCLMCPDETNELADVSVGDAWLPELRNEKIGESVVVARTRLGEEFLKEAASSGVISLKRVDCERVGCSQAGPLRFKKEDLGTRLAMMESRGMKVPVFTVKPRSSGSFFSFARNLFVFLNVRASENGNLRRFLRGVPFPVFRLYYGLYRFLLSF